MNVYRLPEDQGLDRRNDGAEPQAIRAPAYHSGGPGPGPRTVHKTFIVPEA